MVISQEIIDLVGGACPDIETNIYRKYGNIPTQIESNRFHIYLFPKSSLKYLVREIYETFLKEPYSAAKKRSPEGDFKVKTITIEAPDGCKSSIETNRYLRKFFEHKSKEEGLPFADYPTKVINVGEDGFDEKNFLKDIAYFCEIGNMISEIDKREAEEKKERDKGVEERTLEKYTSWLQ